MQHRQRQPGGGAQRPHQIGMRLVGLVHQEGLRRYVRCLLQLAGQRCCTGHWHIPCTGSERFSAGVACRVGRRPAVVDPVEPEAIPCRQSPPRRSRRRAPPSRPRASEPTAAHAAAVRSAATLTLSSKNYSSWSLRGWLMARFAGLDVRRGDRRARRRRRAQGTAAALAVDPRALPDARRHQGVEHARDRRVPRPRSSRRPDCCRPTAPRVRTAARSAARCTPASAACARRCR